MRSLETVGHGRAALNLVGASHDELRRGQAVVVPGQWEPTSLLDATLVVLPSLDHEVSRRGAYRAYVGSGQFVVRLRLLQKDSLEPGEEGLVRLRLSRRLPLVPGDRYLLREMGRGETVGGGEVLDVQPLLPASRAAPDMRVARVVAERGFVEADLLERLTGVRMSPDLGGRWVADPAARTSAEERIGSALAEAGPLGLDLAVLGELDRAVLAEMDTVVVSAGRARPVAAGAEPLSRHRYVVALEDSLFSPPAPSAIGVDPAELRELVRQGIVVRSGECYFSPIAMEKAARVVAELLAASPAGVSASALREALGTTRKYVLPILAHLDATGMTRRRGDLRVAGPRLAVG
jgi:selenocysteine-specific elongation factor